MKFFLGTHEPSWLEHSIVPLFISCRRLARRVQMPRARTEWALDSGGFSELTMFGEWRTRPVDYVDAVRRYRDEIKRMTWAAPMDWMCEPFILDKTGLTVDQHQGRTVENVSLLREHAPDVPWIPVLQGWNVGDYLACIGRYAGVGIDLTAEPVVGVGSVCRRQGNDEISDIFSELRLAGIRCHAFGVKKQGLLRYAGDLVSADSMAWSYNARRRGSALAGCQHARCQNCYRYATMWRDDLLAEVEAGR